MCTDANTGRKLAATPIATSTMAEATPSRGPTTVAAAITTNPVTITMSSSVTSPAFQPAAIGQPREQRADLPGPDDGARLLL